MDAGPKVAVRVQVDEDFAEALAITAAECSTSPSSVLRQMVRWHLIESPTRLTWPPFPGWQQYALWVAAHIQARKGQLLDFGRRPTFSPWERFGLAADGKTIICFNRITAG